MSGPGPGSFGAVQPGAVPSMAAFEGADPPFAAGSPPDGAPDACVAGSPVLFQQPIRMSPAAQFCAGSTHNLILDVAHLAVN